MKKVYLVHGWDETSEECWFPWIQQKLDEIGVELIKFDMPNTTTPKIREWVKFLDSQVGYLDEETYFIGHCMGCQAIMRYLESKDVTKIGGLFFVTPWFKLLDAAIEDSEDLETIDPWINIEIDFKKVLEFTDNIYCLFSDNDPYVSLDQLDEFKLNLNSTNFIVEEKGHISQEDDVYELNKLLDICKEMLFK